LAGDHSLNGIRNRTVNNSFNCEGHLHWCGDRNLDRLGDRNGPLHNFLHDLLNRVGHILVDNTLHRDRDLYWHPLNHLVWNLDHLLHDLLHRNWHLTMLDAFDRVRYPTLNDLLNRNWNLHAFRDRHLHWDLNDSLNNLLHWVGHITGDNLFHWNRHLHMADNFNRIWNITGDDLFNWHRNLDCFGHNHFVGDLDRTVNNSCHGVRNLTMDNSFNGVWHRPLHHLLNRVGNLHVVGHLYGVVHGNLACDHAIHRNLDRTNNLLHDGIRLVSEDFLGHGVWDVVRLRNAPVNWNWHIDRLLNNLLHGKSHFALDDLFHRVRNLAVSHAFHRDWNLNLLRDGDVVGNGHSTVDHTLHRNWNIPVDDSLNWNNVLPFDGFNDVAALHGNVFNVGNVVAANGALPNKL
jgi:hypothetical protein